MMFSILPGAGSKLSRLMYTMIPATDANEPNTASLNLVQSRYPTRAPIGSERPDRNESLSLPSASGSIKYRHGDNYPLRNIVYCCRYGNGAPQLGIIKSSCKCSNPFRKVVYSYCRAVISPSIRLFLDAPSTIHLLDKYELRGDSLFRNRLSMGNVSMPKKTSDCCPASQFSPKLATGASALLEYVDKDINHAPAENPKATTKTLLIVLSINKTAHCLYLLSPANKVVKMQILLLKSPFLNLFLYSFHLEMSLTALYLKHH